MAIILFLFGGEGGGRLTCFMAHCVSPKLYSKCRRSFNILRHSWFHEHNFALKKHNYHQYSVAYFQVFPGPLDESDHQTIPFVPAIIASKVLLNVLTYTGSITLAFEFLGCPLRDNITGKVHV